MDIINYLIELYFYYFDDTIKQVLSVPILFFSFYFFIKLLKTKIFSFIIVVGLILFFVYHNQMQTIKLADETKEKQKLLQEMNEGGFKDYEKFKKLYENN